MFLHGILLVSRDVCFEKSYLCSLFYSDRRPSVDTEDSATVSHMIVTDFLVPVEADVEKHESIKEVKFTKRLNSHHFFLFLIFFYKSPCPF